MNTSDIQSYMTHSLRGLPEGEKAARILAQSVAGVDPGHGVREHMSLEEGHLNVDGRLYPLDPFQGIILIGIGKASLSMSKAAYHILGETISKGVVLSKGSSSKGSLFADISRIEVYQGGHPYPDQHSVEAADVILDILRGLGEEHLVLFLISGGGSALLSAPVPGLTIAELAELNRVLLGCGASITEINTVRKHLSRVKGGQLAKAAAPCTMVSLILSDVVGDPLEMIASGPTLPDSTTYADALEVIRTYKLESEVPSAALAHLKNGTLGKVPETPKPGDAAFQNAQYVLTGNNLMAARAGLNRAQREGFHTLHLTSFYEGEAREIGLFLSGVLRQMAASGDPLPRPGCLIAGGEATVTLREGTDSGRGGRNQELALSAVQGLAGLGDAALITLATDGNDGPTDAAGAVVTGETYSRGLDLNLQPQDYLQSHDAYHYFDKLDDLLKPGLTGTNVNDLIFLFTF